MTEILSIEINGLEQFTRAVEKLTQSGNVFVSGGAAAAGGAAPETTQAFKSAESLGKLAQEGFAEQWNTLKSIANIGIKSIKLVFGSLTWLANKIKTVFTAAFDVLKKVTLSVVSVLGGIMFMSKRLSDQMIMSRTLGANVQTSKFLESSLGRFGASGSGLQSMAAEAQVPGSLLMYGIGGRPNESPVDLYLRSLRKLHTEVNRPGGFGASELTLNTFGLGKVFDINAALAMKHTSREELETQISEFQQNRQSQIENERAIQDFTSKFTNAFIKIETAIVNGFTPILKPLQELGAELNRQLTGLVGKDLLSKLGQSTADLITRFTKWISSPDVEKTIKEYWNDLMRGMKEAWNAVSDIITHTDWKAFGDSIKEFIDGVVRFGDYLSEFGPTEANKAAWESTVPPAGTFGGLLKKSGKEQFAPIMEYFMGQGWSKEQSAGISANLFKESGFDPSKKGDFDPKTGKYTSFGVAQWHGDRIAKFKKMTGKDILDASLEEQLAFVNWELLEGGYKEAGRHLKAARSAEEAGSIITKEYEIPKDAEGKSVERGSLAKVFSSMYDKKEPELFRLRRAKAAKKMEGLPSEEFPITGGVARKYLMPQLPNNQFTVVNATGGNSVIQSSRMPKK